MNLSDLKPNPDNPRTINKESYERLKTKLEKNPDGLSVFRIAHRDGIIIAGNQRWRAINELGFELKEDWFKDLSGWTEQQVTDWLIDSNISEGEWDVDMLYNQYEPEYLIEHGIDIPYQVAEDVEEDEAPEVSSEPPVSKLGEVYQLGRHRVMCGDSTDFGAICDLLDGSNVDIILTDPPYGMNAVSGSGVLTKTYGTDIIRDDDNSVAIKCFKATRDIEAKQEVWWGANYYSSALPDSECWIVWDKNNNGGSDQTDAELAWGNMRSVVRMFTQSSEKKNRVHPTQKPVELSAWVFKQFKSGTNVMDLFLGSGSTLIACEQTDRTCYGMEIEPKYVDVIRKRYAKFVNNNELPENWEELTPCV